MSILLLFTGSVRKPAEISKRSQIWSLIQWGKAESKFHLLSAHAYFFLCVHIFFRLSRLTDNLELARPNFFFPR